MQADKTAIERAFDLAKSGKFKTVLAIKRELSREGYSTIQIAGLFLIGCRVKQSGALKSRAPRIKAPWQDSLFGHLLTFGRRVL